MAKRKDAEKLFKEIEVDLISATSPSFDTDMWTDMVIEKLEEGLRSAKEKAWDEGNYCGLSPSGPQKNPYRREELR